MLTKFLLILILSIHLIGCSSNPVDYVENNINTKASESKIQSVEDSNDKRGVKKTKISPIELSNLYKESHALIIGVSEYKDPLWPDLKTVNMDLIEVKKSLIYHGFNVETLLNPSSDEMIYEIEKFIRKYGYDKDNRLFFYYSGHGYTQNNKGRQFGYLVPSNAPNPENDEKGFYKNSLKMRQFLSWSKQIESKHALFLFDSCFSGSILKSRSHIVPQDISYMTTKPVRQFITSGSADQLVPAESLFRLLFIRGINGEADLDKDGYVTGSELGSFLIKRVSYYNPQQTPQYGKIRDPLLDQGNFVFYSPKNDVSGSFQSLNKSFTLYRYSNHKKFINSGKKWFNDGDNQTYAVYEGSTVDGIPSGEGVLNFPNGRKYIGEMENGQYDGFGIYYWPQGSKYEGGFIRGLRNGSGVFTWTTGEKFVGEFKNNKRWSGILYDNSGSEHKKWRDGVSFKIQPKQATLYQNIKGGKWSFKKMTSKHNLYFGQHLNGTPEGQGRITLHDKSVYVGEFHKGIPHGQGKMTWFTGKTYTGSWRFGVQHGQGIEIDEKGRKYVGGFDNDTAHGDYVLTFPDGYKETGEFNKGIKFGQGTENHPDGKSYSGEYKNGKRHGIGIMKFPDGGSYSGEWKDGWAHGKGTFIYPNGITYTGDIVKGELHGKGTRALPDGGIYNGDFKNSKMNGYGILKWPNGTEYRGYWKDSLRHGKGISKEPNGSVYDGHFINGIQEGQGVLYSPNGSTIYDGEWENGYFHGNGILSINNGKFKGTFKNGNSVGIGVLITPDKKNIEGYLKNGKFQKKDDGYYSSKKFKYSIKYDSSWNRNSSKDESLDFSLMCVHETCDQATNIGIIVRYFPKLKNEPAREFFKLINGETLIKNFKNNRIKNIRIIKEYISRKNVKKFNLISEFNYKNGYKKKSHSQMTFNNGYMYGIIFSSTPDNYENDYKLAVNVIDSFSFIE